VGLEGVLGEAAVEHPVVQAVGEGQVAGLVSRPLVDGQVTRGLLGHGAGLAGPGRHRQPVHDRVGDPDRRAGRDGRGQAVEQANRMRSASTGIRAVIS
jgi:hypothetical protein